MHQQSKPTNTVNTDYHNVTNDKIIQLLKYQLNLVLSLIKQENEDGRAKL